MIKFLKSKIAKNELEPYVTIGVVLFFSVIVTITNKYVNSKNNGLVINKIPILEKLEDGRIGVYINGEVNKAGYIKIAKGSRLENAIDKAGGITKDADIQNIDLKKTLKNQEKIIIPAMQKNDDEESIISKDSKYKININSATKEELTSLEGIGDKTAENIIVYRKNKKFYSIEEIMEVKGIGKSKFDKIEENICI